MLHIYPDTVKAHHAGNLNYTAAVNIDFKATDYLTTAKFPQDAAGSHFHNLILSSFRYLYCAL